MRGTHWTTSDPDGYRYRIASDFATQIGEQMKAKKLTQAQLARTIGVSKGYISQILANPGNLTLKTMILFARALGLKVSVVAYDDDDVANVNGPIHSEVFRLCWEKYGKPRDMFDFAESAPTALAFEHALKPYSFDKIASTELYTQNVAITTSNDDKLLEHAMMPEMSHA